VAKTNMEEKYITLVVIGSDFVCLC